MYAIRSYYVRNRRYLAGLTFYTLYYLISGALSLLLPMYLLAGESLDELTAGQLSSLGVLCTVVALPLYFRIAKHLPDRRYVMGFGFMFVITSYSIHYTKLYD